MTRAGTWRHGWATALLTFAASGTLGAEPLGDGGASPPEGGSADAEEGAAGAPAGPRRAQACTDSVRWRSNLWAYLSLQERDAWGVLGWMQPTWDALHSKRRLSGPDASEAMDDPDEPADVERPAAPLRRAQAITSTTTTTITTLYVPPSETSCYQDLKPEEQDAVRTLGYTISTWHVCKNPACSWPPGMPRPTDPCLDRMDYLEKNYDYNKTWFDLTDATRKALITLGWDSAGSMWSRAEKPPTYASKWSTTSSDLFPREMEAAAFLGYTPDVWNGCREKSKCLVRLARAEAKVRSWSWSTMPPGTQKFLVELGWDTVKWSEGEQPASYRQTWAALPYQKRTFARLLGYTDDVWELCPSSPCLDRFEYAKKKFSKTWGQMYMAEQRAWKLLQHTSALWEKSGMMGTRAFMLRWEELTTEQRQAAVFLGHNKETWQGCSTDFVPPKFNATINASQGAVTGGLTPAQIEKAMEEEKRRNAWTEANACNLQQDARKGMIKCPVAGARGGAGAAAAAWLLALAAAALRAPAPAPLP